MSELRFTLHCRCRHGAIAKYFGDKVPDCRKSCDYCKGPDELLRYSKQFKQQVVASSSRSRHRVRRNLYRLSGLVINLYVVCIIYEFLSVVR